MKSFISSLAADSLCQSVSQLCAALTGSSQSLPDSTPCHDVATTVRKLSAQTVTCDGEPLRPFAVSSRKSKPISQSTAADADGHVRITKIASYQPPEQKAAVSNPAWATTAGAPLDQRICDGLQDKCNIGAAPIPIGDTE